MKIFFAFCSLFLFVFQATTEPLALVVLNTAAWRTGRGPMDWQVKVNHGRPQYEACMDTAGPCLHLKSVAASFALERKVDVHPTQMPYLTWRWKVTHLPNGGDFRKNTADDQAAQVLVAFDDNRVITYIWDSTAPKGTAQATASYPFVRIFAVVCQSGAADIDLWVPESHNIAADYERAFGRPATHVKGIRLQINSQHTGTVAESYFGDVAFRSTPQ